MGSSVHVTFGKIGTAGQKAKPKAFPDAAKAMAFFVKKANEKRKKGYLDAVPPAAGGGGGGRSPRYGRWRCR